jgi:geranylgeranyl pyrophosphate synthase
MTERLAAWTASTLPAFESALLARFEDADAGFREALRYPLQTGGKRIRPLLTFAAAEAVGGRSTDALPVALALELVHTYSLVHDDLPAMDDDDLRRGRPTVHKVYGEALAILVGDALLTEAFVEVAHAPLLVRELASAAGAVGMVGGQVLDIAGGANDLAALTRLHARKTGALIRAAVRMGGLSAGASAAAMDTLTTYGEAMGLAFQVADDVLDAAQDAAPDGPPSFVRLLGVDGAGAEAARLAGVACAAAAALPNGAMLADLARFAVERSS